MPDVKVAVIGARGRLGSAIVDALPYEVLTPGRDLLDLHATDRIGSALDALGPDLVINAAAYTDVDRAEEERDAAMRINADAPREIGAWAARNQVPLVHFSTDFVFSGRGEHPWSESSEAAPLNHYGMTKLEGERRVQEAGGAHLIVRTSWLFGRRGGSFVRSVLREGARGNDVTVVVDQIGSPTYVDDLAGGLVEIMSRSDALRSITSGVLHLANSGWVSRAALAAAAIHEATQLGILQREVAVVETRTENLASAARRPLNSRLDCIKAEVEYGVRLPGWEDALRRCLGEFVL